MVVTPAGMLIVAFRTTSGTISVSCAAIDILVCNIGNIFVISKPAVCFAGVSNPTVAFV